MRKVFYSSLAPFPVDNFAIACRDICTQYPDARISKIIRSVFKDAAAEAVLTAQAAAAPMAAPDGH